MKKTITLFVVVVFVIGIGVKLQSAVQAAQVSLPVSYVVDNENKIINSGNISLLIPRKLKYLKEDETFGNANFRNVVRIWDADDTNDSRLDIRIIPLNVDSKDSALKTLEKYLVTFVGVISKNNQKISNWNGFEIAQVGYNPAVDDSVNYFRVYTLLKKDDRAWVITLGYFTDFSKVDSLDFENSPNTLTYLKIIKTFIEKNVSSEDQNNNISFRNVKKEWIDIYHKLNSKFDSTI